MFQAYFCSAMSSKIRHMRLKRKQEQSNTVPEKKAPKKAAVAQQSRPEQMDTSISADDFERYMTEMKVCMLHLSDRLFLLLNTMPRVETISVHYSFTIVHCVKIAQPMAR